jgi:hypothetical protein
MMARVLVIANETIGGQKLLDAVKARAEQGDAEFFLVVPQNRPRHGNVIYDEAVRDAAQVRVDLARRFMRDLGYEITGEVGDDDPYSAAMDAIREYQPDEVIVSTHPVTSSGWLRRDLVERIEQASGLPVQHVVVDLETEGLPFAVTLVVANRTVDSSKLLEHLKGKAAESPHLFILVVPQEGGAGGSTAEARERLQAMLGALRAEELVCAGVIGDPDPYTATMNGLQSFRVTDVVISTLPGSRSGWLRADLIERVRKATAVPVTHVESEPDRAAAEAAR